MVTLIGVPREDTWFISADGLAQGAAGIVDLFNAAGSGKTIKIMHASVRAVQAAVGAENIPRIFRTVAVGTGGSVIAPVKAVTSQAALPAQVTARTGPTAGATISGIQLGSGYIASRSATGATGSPEDNAVIYDFKPMSEMTPLTLVTGEGMVISGTGSGTWDFTIVFTIK